MVLRKKSVNPKWKACWRNAHNSRTLVMPRDSWLRQGRYFLLPRMLWYCANPLLLSTIFSPEQIVKIWMDMRCLWKFQPEEWCSLVMKEKHPLAVFSNRKYFPKIRDFQLWCLKFLSWNLPSTIDYSDLFWPLQFCDISVRCILFHICCCHSSADICNFPKLEL